jgi:hypothetical protein
MNIGDTAYLVGVRMFPTNITEGMFAGLRLPGLAVMSGTVVAVDDSSVSVDIPNGHNSPWNRDKDEVFASEEDAIAHLKVRLEKMRLIA